MNYEPYASLLLETLWRHCGRTVLAKNACLALATLLRTSGESPEHSEEGICG